MAVAESYCAKLIETRAEQCETEPDSLGLEGAHKLKARIEAYWAARGHAVQVLLIDGAFTPQVRSTRTDIRSDMVNGLPRPRA